MKKGIIHTKHLRLLWLLRVGLCLILINTDVFAQTIQLPDTAFRNFLKSYPKVIDPTTGRLVITEAAKITGSMDGSPTAFPITNIEGLQYFTGLSAIRFGGKGLAMVPDLSNMVDLEVISLMRNNITTLPSLSNLKKLRSLVASTNKLTSFPDLSQNTNLVELNINGNLIDSIKGLGALAKIETLSVHNNKLKSLPGVDKLTTMKEFRCYGNPMGNFPPLDKLTNIRDFNSSNTLLTSAPDFGPKSKIQVIDVDHNDITFLPDYTGYDSLRDVWLEYNRLTFSELLKITPKQDYKAIFHIAPQRTIEIGKTIVLSEGSPFTFSTEIDAKVPDVNYTWFKNGVKLATVTGDKWTLSNVQVQDSGRYTCQLSHPAFEDFYLQTDTFIVSVTPCLMVSNFSFTVTGATCQKSGSLAVNTLVASNNSYELKSLGSGKVYASSDGKFEGLAEPAYSLTIKTPSGCSKVYPKEIKVPVQKCQDYLVTPNNDGNADTFFFETNGKVEIYDKWGNVIKRMNTPSEWDCTSEKGKVPNGYYIANVNDGESHIGISVVY